MANEVVAVARQMDNGTADDVLRTGPDRAPTVDGVDYAQAFVDEIVDPGHSRTRFTLGY